MWLPYLCLWTRDASLRAFATWPTSLQRLSHRTMRVKPRFEIIEHWFEIVARWWIPSLDCRPYADRLTGDGVCCVAGPGIGRTLYEISWTPSGSGTPLLIRNTVGTVPDQRRVHSHAGLLGSSQPVGEYSLCQGPSHVLPPVRQLLQVPRRERGESKLEGQAVWMPACVAKFTGNRVSHGLFGAGKAFSRTWFSRRVSGKWWGSLPVGYKGWGMWRHGATAQGWPNGWLPVLLCRRDPSLGWSAPPAGIDDNEHLDSEGGNFGVSVRLICWHVESMFP